MHRRLALKRHSDERCARVAYVPLNGAPENMGRSIETTKEQESKGQKRFVQLNVLRARVHAPDKLFSGMCAVVHCRKMHVGIYNGKTLRESVKLYG